jgi:hypothetical protein
MDWPTKCRRPGERVLGALPHPLPFIVVADFVPHARFENSLGPRFKTWLVEKVPNEEQHKSYQAITP